MLPVFLGQQTGFTFSLSGLFTWALAYSASPSTAAANTPLRYAVPKGGLQGMIFEAKNELKQYLSSINPIYAKYTEGLWASESTPSLSLEMPP
ncbi:TPA: hypothetical protein ACH3X3_006335 [Trebouxia sp. C0006]